MQHHYSPSQLHMDCRYYRLTTTTLPIILNPPAHTHRHVPFQLRSKILKNNNCVALTKQGQRFLSSVATSTAYGDSSATKSLINKFVSSSPKSVALDALSHLLSPHSSLPLQFSSLVLPLYSKISKQSWFDWNPKLLSNVIAFLDKQGQSIESAALVSESVTKLQGQERALVLFYCNLIESHAKHNSIEGFHDCYAQLNQLICDSKSVYVKRQGYKAMVNGLCEMNRPGDAENLTEEMRVNGLRPSLFECRCVLYGYGRLGLLKDMQRILDEMIKEGFEVDTVCANMILASYGSYNGLPEMVLWLKKMKNLGIPFSVRTYNSVLNSCPTVMSMMLQTSSTYPISIEELMKILNEDEATLVKELAESSILDDAMKWDASEAKLDLHGMHTSSAYLILLQWMGEMRKRLDHEKYPFPAEITVICGSGNHSSIRGESAVKSMVKKLMVQTSSPMRIDRKNSGCFVAKAKTVKQWLSCM